MRCLHLLTLGVHEAIDAKLEGSNSGTSYCKDYFALWRETSVVESPQSQPGAESTSGGSLPNNDEACLLHVLRRLPSTAWASDATIGRALKWLLKQATRLDATCAEALQKYNTAAQASDSGGESMEARRKAARERAMAAMAAKASAFMASAEMEDSDLESDGEEEGGGVTSADAGSDEQTTTTVDRSDGSRGTGTHSGEASDQTEVVAAAEGSSDDTTEVSPTAPAIAHGNPEYECIICREASESRPLGLLGMAQVCKTVGGVVEPNGEGEGGGGAFQATSHRMRSGVTITCCGHALHYECYEAYFASTVMQNACYAEHLLLIV